MTDNTREMIDSTLTRISIPVLILQECFQAEIDNVIDLANTSQGSFHFYAESETIKFDEGEFRLPNGALDIEKAVNALAAQHPDLKKSLPGNPLLVTSRPISDNDLEREFRGKSLTEELSM